MDYAGTMDSSPFFTKRTLIVITAIIVFVALSLHALATHGEAARITWECFQAKGSIKQMFRPDDQRTAHICEVAPGTFGIVVCEADGSNVTCYFKEKMKESFEKVVRYLENRGYK